MYLFPLLSWDICISITVSKKNWPHLLFESGCTTCTCTYIYIKICTCTYTYIKICTSSYFVMYIGLHTSSTWSKTPCVSWKVLYISKEECIMKFTLYIRDNSPVYDTNEYVMSQTRIRHIKHTKESCVTQEWVILHTWMSHVTHMPESFYALEWVMSHYSTGILPAVQFELLIRQQRVMSHTWIRNVTRVHTSCRTHERITSHIWMSHITLLYRNTFSTAVWPAHPPTVSCVCEYVFMCVWMCVSIRVFVCVRHVCDSNIFSPCVYRVYVSSTLFCYSLVNK